MQLQDKLDGDVPRDVPHWIVECHCELDGRDLTPLEAVRQAAQEVGRGHCWLVTHVRSGLTWSVNIERGEAIEVKTKHGAAKC
jgi:hypothetical protein